MIEFLNELDQSLFLFLNGAYSTLMDQIMVFLTNRYYPIPVYLLLIILVIWRFKLKGLWIVITIALTVLVANHITSEIMKPLFGRLRPCHDESIQDKVHLLIKCKGLYAFASSHASTTFSLITSLWLLLRKQYSWLGWLFIWAALVSYSRVHVGVHYPGDILFGGLVGWLIGLLFYRIYLIIDKKYSIGVDK